MTGKAIPVLPASFENTLLAGLRPQGRNPPEAGTGCDLHGGILVQCDRTCLG